MKQLELPAPVAAINSSPVHLKKHISIKISLKDLRDCKTREFPLPTKHHLTVVCAPLWYTGVQCLWLNVINIDIFWAAVAISHNYQKILQCRDIVWEGKWLSLSSKSGLMVIHLFLLKVTVRKTTLLHKIGRFFNQSWPICKLQNCIGFWFTQFSRDELIFPINSQISRSSNQWTDPLSERQSPLRQSYHHLQHHELIFVKSICVNHLRLSNSDPWVQYCFGHC